jgi:hypothetical protein
MHAGAPLAVRVLRGHLLRAEYAWQCAFENYGILGLRAGRLQ